MDYIFLSLSLTLKDSYKKLRKILKKLQKNNLIKALNKEEKMLEKSEMINSQSKIFNEVTDNAYYIILEFLKNWYWDILIEHMFEEIKMIQTEHIGNDSVFEVVSDLRYLFYYSSLEKILIEYVNAWKLEKIEKFLSKLMDKDKGTLFYNADVVMEILENKCPKNSALYLRYKKRFDIEAKELEKQSEEILSMFLELAVKEGIMSVKKPTNL